VLYYILNILYFHIILPGWSFTLRSKFMRTDSGNWTQLKSKSPFQHGLRHVSQSPLLINIYIHRYAVTSLPRRCDCLLYKEYPATKLCKLCIHTCGWEYINVSPKEMGVNLWIGLNRLRVGYSGWFFYKR